MKQNSRAKGFSARAAEIRRRASNEVLFYLNGKRTVVLNPDPAKTVSDYLRSETVGLVGAKTPCREGGCGGCTVVVGSRDPKSGAVRFRPLNSCLLPLCAVDGKTITTIEALGSVATELNPIQDRIATTNGSQCGYCTPGFVMSMYSLLCSKPKPTPQEIEDNFDGNLCRCTGYRFILDAMQSFSGDAPPAQPVQAVTIEETASGHSKKAIPCTPNHLHDAPFRAKADRVAPPEFPSELAGHPPRTLYSKGPDCEWYSPHTLEDACALKNALGPSAVYSAARTSVAIYPERQATRSVFIDLCRIDRLHEKTSSAEGIEIGGAVVVQAVFEFLDEVIAKRKGRGTEGLAALRDLIRRVAGHPVRSAATVGGNLNLTRHHARTNQPFPSDLATALTALDAVAEAYSAQWRGSRAMPLHDYLAGGLPDDVILVSLKIGFSRTGEYAHTYKLARRYQNAHSLVNGAMRVRLTPKGAVLPGSPRIVLGGIGRLPVRAARTEALLNKQIWSEAALQAALPVLEEELRSELIPFDTAPAEYRLSAAISLFYKFFVSVASRSGSAKVAKNVRTAGQEEDRPISGGVEDYQVHPEEFPVSEPIVKLTAFSQASGEPLYTHDLPWPARTLHGAMVLSLCAKGAFEYIGGLDSVIREVKERWPDVVDYLTVRDVPPGGKNMIGVGGDDPVFADGSVLHAGQPIGFVVAESERVAHFAAAHIRERCIRYHPDKPLLSIEEAIEQNSIFPDHPPTAPFLAHLPYIERPGSDKDWLKDPSKVKRGCRSVSGAQKTGAQGHFYLETQCTLAVPQPNNTLLLHVSTQDQDGAQWNTAHALGIPANRVVVNVPLVGGGFGGKTNRCVFISIPAAIAAMKYRRPVRAVLERFIDMQMIGKRHPFLGKYDVMFDSDGKIEGLKMRMWSDGGYSYDASFFIMDEAQLNADNAYMIPTYRTEGQVCRTNKASNTAMRSFGVMQSSLVREEAIERVAHELGMLPETVRRLNFYRTASEEDFDTTPYGEPLKFCDIRDVWDQLAESAEFAAREEKVREFNRNNRWRKRGISMIPLKYGVGYARRMLNQARCIVNVYGSDGSVSLLQGGVEMGQGIHTKMAQVAALKLNVPFSLVRPMDIDTRAIGNAICTGASTGSDLNGGAVEMACDMLRTRLESLCLQQKKLHGEQFCKDQGIDFWNYREGWQARVKTKTGTEPSLMWLNVVQLAESNRLDLTAEALFKTPHLKDVNPDKPIGKPYYYFNYCVACSEVEIDVLTGEFTILRADILYDAGKSLNPLLDTGQVQGGFVQGVGNVTTEEVLFDEKGRLLTDGTWEYKPPCTKTIPIDFRVTLLRRDRFLQPGKPPLPGALLDTKDGKTVIVPAAVQSSRTVGEPPFVLANTVFFAIKHAIQSARSDAGRPAWFELEAPATIARIQQACLVSTDDFRLKGRAAGAAK